MSQEAIENWEYSGGPTQQGAQWGYTDLAIKTCLQLKLAYGLALRQVEGVVGSLFELMGLDLDVPDYSLLSKRQHRKRQHRKRQHRKRQHRKRQHRKRQHRKQHGR